MPNQTTDILIVGGGVMGCAIAYYLLKANESIKITIIERDSTYNRASTTLSEGNIRVQFNIKENIEMSLYGLQVLANFAEEMATEDHVPDIAFRQQGNLFIIDATSEELAREGLKLQKSLGCQVEWLEPEQVKAVYPPYNLVDCVGATFGPTDGSMSPLDVLLGYRHKVIALGAAVIEAEVSHLLKNGDQMSGVALTSGEVLSADIVVNTAGAWAPKLAQTVDVTLPIKATKRQVYAIETPLHFDHILPALLLPSGQYCFHEAGGHFTAGGSRSDDPITYDDFSWSKTRFEEHLWAGFVKYLPDFDRLKVTQGWAGLYAVNTFDGNAILGEWPELKGLFLANGFSGHGFQQSHAVGRYLAELILGQPPTLDLSIFSPQRILDNKPVFENPRKII